MKNYEDGWWKKRVFYQIYPISYYDSNGDGIGDLRGIRKKLPYLKELGIGGLWICPFYQSPLEYDYGYGPANLYKINPLFGDMNEFDQLLEEAHSMDIAIIMEWAVGNTSAFGEWFQESKSSRTNPKSDWYMWSDEIPNNWVTYFTGGSAWHYCAERNQYYLGMFCREHAELNWRNPEVREAIYDAFEFWMKKGIDGFRLDVVGSYYKDKQLRNNPVKEVDYKSLLDPEDPIQESKYKKYLVPQVMFFDHIHDGRQPETFDVNSEFRRIADKYRNDAFLVGEVDIESEMGQKLCRSGMSAAFDFSMMTAQWGAGSFRDTLLKHKSELDAFHCSQTFANHDTRRSINRYEGKDRAESCAKAKLLATMTITLRGLPMLYYGEEIGMEDINLKYEELRDTMSRDNYALGGSLRIREGGRGIMRWDETDKNGFTTDKPWMRSYASESGISVSAQTGKNGSMLEFYRELIHLRNTTTALQTGQLDFVDNDHEKVLSYRRTDNEGSYSILLNFDSQEQSVSISQLGSTAKSFKVLLSSNGVCDVNDTRIMIPAFGSVVVEESK